MIRNEESMGNEGSQTLITQLTLAIAQSEGSNC